MHMCLCECSYAATEGMLFAVLHFSCGVKKTRCRSHYNCYLLWRWNSKQKYTCSPHLPTRKKIRVRMPA